LRFELGKSDNQGSYGCTPERKSVLPAAQVSSLFVSLR
jgi:hypothetical protein